MILKVKDLEGPSLDWAVAKCEFPHLIWGETIGLSSHARGLIVIPEFKEPKCYWSPSSSWTKGGPIIERERITVENFKGGGKWSAFKFDTGDCEIAAETPLIAAMRCYVASEVGEEIDVPDELIGGVP